MDKDEIRNVIVQKAAELDCVGEVSALSDIQAIRYIQRREGNTPCYARDIPLIPHIDPYTKRVFERSCGISDCCWKRSCEDYRLMNPLQLGKGKATRDQIIEHADRFDCVQDIVNLSDIDAIRLIQQKGGYTPCYARENPLFPSDKNPRACAELACYWKQPCDSYRNEWVIPIDKELSTESYTAIEVLRQRISEFQAKLSSHSGKTVGLQIRNFQKIFSASRKMLLVSPETIVGESTEETSALKRYVIADHSNRVSSGSVPNVTFEYAFDVLFASDITQLNQWLSETHPFIESGNLAYFPLIKRFTHQINLRGLDPFSPGAIPSFWSLPKSLELKTFHAPYLGVPDGDIMLTHSEFAPILNIDLPVLENLDFRTLFKLMTDFPEELCSFRDFLQSKMEEMRQAAIGSEQFARESQRIEREIREHLRKLDSDYKKAKLKAAFSLTGTAVAGWTLALYCFLQGTGDLLTVLGPGGLLYTASAAYSEYLTKRLDLKDDPVYFLWSLGNTKRKG